MEDIQRSYGRAAEQYIELFGDTAEMHPDDLELIERHLSRHPGAVLDVGCGPGHLTAFLRSLDVDATGIDVVPEFIEHARSTHPDGQYELGSMVHLPVPDSSLAGVLAWYSLIHMTPADLDTTLGELRRAMAPAGRLVVGFFDGQETAAFDHKVTTAYLWPIDEFATRLARAGFMEVDRWQRSGTDVSGSRPHAGLAAVAV